MLRKSILSLCLLLLAVPAFTFENDLTLGQVKQRAGQTIVADLAVGERAYVNYYSLCWQRSQLYLSPYGEVITNGKGTYEIEFRRLAGMQGDLKIPLLKSKQALVAMSRRVSCDIWDDVAHHRAELIKIDTINGARKISELLR